MTMAHSKAKRNTHEAREEFMACAEEEHAQSTTGMGLADDKL